MTANRWWVRLGARWLARIDGASGIVQMATLSVTAFSTFSIMLQNFGMGYLVPYLGLVSTVGFVVFVYLYAEGGVWNQVSRDRVDMSTNYAGPTMRMDEEMAARAILAGLKQRPLTEEEREAIKAEADDVFFEYRDGIPEEKLQ